MKRVLVFYIISVMLLWENVSPIFAKAPLIPKILFTSERDGNREVYMMNPDGSEQVNLTRHPADDQRAVWSPTGEQVLFLSDRGGVRDLYLMNPDGSKVRRVLKKKAKIDRVSPAWSPDGKQIAYEVLDWDGHDFGIRIVNLGEQKSEFFEKYAAPAWSPDGTEIACVAADPVGTWIIFIDYQTRKQERLLPRKVLLWQHLPSWSAAGDKLAFSGNKHPRPVILDRDLHNAWAAKRTIFIVNRDGTGLQQLVEEAGPAALLPALSPNGDQVLYTQKINEQEHIFKVQVPAD